MRIRDGSLPVPSAMPPLARMLVPALEDLARQLRFAPREALLRDIHRAEGLAASIRPEGAYDEAVIIGRITGYQPTLEAPATIVGGALLADLSAFVERLSDFAGLAPDDLPDGSLGPDALCERWRVSRKTLDRYRKRGLVARRFTGHDAKVRLAFTADVVGAFEARERAAIDRAASFSRISGTDEARMIRRAARYRRRFGCTLNEAAQRLAARFGRSHEAVRQVLRRHERTLPPSGRTFTEPSPPDSRFQRLAWRVWRRGLDPGLLARRSGRSRVSIVRAVNHHRAALLLGLAETAPTATEEQADRILSAAPARTGLGTPAITDAKAWIDWSRESGPSLGAEERIRAQAYHILRARALAIAHALSGQTPEAEPLDRAETCLRWAARLKAELVRAQHGLLVRTLEARLGRSLEEMRAADLAELVRRGVRAVADVIDAHDPFGGPGRHPGRLAAPAGLAIDRAVVRWLKSDDSRATGRGRAAPRLAPGASLEDWTRVVCPWQSWTEPDRRVRLGAESLDGRSREFLERRFGWDGGPPATLESLAPALGLTRITVVLEERRLIRAAVAAVRGVPDHAGEP